MESFYNFADEMWPEFEPVEELGSNFSAMIDALILGVHDPRLNVK